MERTKSDWYLQRQGVNVNYCIRLNEGTNKIGRSFTSEIRIENSIYCSRDHCNIYVNKDNVYLEDHSFNGTFINEKQILNDTSDKLKHNDVISIGVENVDPDQAEANGFFIFKLKNVLRRSQAKRGYENTIVADHSINEPVTVKKSNPVSKRSSLPNACDPQNIIYPFNRIVTRSYLSSKKKPKSNK